MKLTTRKLRVSCLQATAIAVVLSAANSGASPLDVLDLPQRDRAKNDLNLLIQTTQTAWAYAEDKQEHFGVDLQRLLKEGNAAIEQCRTKRDILELLQETVAEFKDGHAGLGHPDLRNKETIGELPHRLLNTKEGVVFGKDLVVLWNGRDMEEQIRITSKPICASTPGMRRALALRALETSGTNDPVRVTLKRPDGRLIETNLAYGNAKERAPVMEFKWLTNQIAYLRLSSFRVEAVGQRSDTKGPQDPSGHAIAVIDEAKARVSAAFSQAAKAQCLILDLRGNLGGTDLLGSHVALHLIPGTFKYFKLQTRFSPQLRSVRGMEDSSTNGWSSASEWGPDRPASLMPFPGLVFVLQDSLCFSTTDNLLACLQDLLPRDRVRFIGRPSGGGTGAPRVLATLPWTGAAVTLTIMKVFSPKGRLIEGRGTIPDRIVEWTWKDILEDRDADLEAAFHEASLLISSNGVPPESPASPPAATE